MTPARPRTGVVHHQEHPAPSEKRVAPMPELLPDGRFDASGDPFRPDVDALLQSWARRVRANAEQVDRFAEQRSQDHYAPVAERFRVDPHRTDDPSLDALRALARPDETWLDIGAGGGRYALPIALVTQSADLKQRAEEVGVTRFVPENEPDGVYQAVEGALSRVEVTRP